MAEAVHVFEAGALAVEGALEKGGDFGGNAVAWVGGWRSLGRSLEDFDLLHGGGELVVDGSVWEEGCRHDGADDGEGAAGIAAAQGVGGNLQCRNSVFPEN